MSQEPQSDRMQDSESEMPEPRAGSNEAQPDPVEDRLEQGLREAFALGRTSDTDDTEKAPAAGVEESDEASRSLPVAFSSRYRPHRQDRGEVRTSLPARGSQISRRSRPLEPEIVPEPRWEMPQNGAVGPLMRFSLVVMFAAVVAYGVTKLSSLQLGDGWIQSASDRVGSIGSGLRAPPVEQTPPVGSLPPSHLVVGDQQAFANEPLPLTVVVEHPRQDEVLLFTGLVAGTRLSAGTSTGASTWQLPTDKLTGLYLYPPKDFVGVMHAAVDLIGADKRLLDSRAVQLKWIPKQTNPARAPAAPPALAEVPAPAADAVLAPAQAAEAATVLSTTGDHAGVGAPRTAVVEPIDPGEVDFLMQQGQQALTGGDISAARVAFRRLAMPGTPRPR